MYFRVFSGIVSFGFQSFVLDSVNIPGKNSQGAARHRSGGGILAS
jgi:hypothetical protein